MKYKALVVDDKKILTELISDYFLVEDIQFM